MLDACAMLGDSTGITPRIETARPRARQTVRAHALRALKIMSIAAAFALHGCGFQLEGAGALPPEMSATYLQSAQPNSVFYARLREALRLRGLRIVADPELAGATLNISEDDTGQRVLSVSARNIPREYEIFYAVTFSLQAGTDSLIEPESLVLTRAYTYDETQVLGKSQEERILRRALADDLARQVVRRIEAAGPRVAVPKG
jgi:LPS-assembly lipoprotein